MEYLFLRVSISLNVGNFSGAIFAIFNAFAWCGYISSMGVSSSFLDLEVSLLSRPNTPFGIARKVEGIWVLSPLRYFKT